MADEPEYKFSTNAPQPVDQTKVNAGNNGQPPETQSQIQVSPAPPPVKKGE
jgi:hypothetical protein